jgi:alpha-galactosidase
VLRTRSATDRGRDGAVWYARTGLQFGRKYTLSTLSEFASKVWKILQLLDDCWASVDRDANGNIQPDPTRFPSGIPALANYVHERGLLLGLYTCAGERTCKYNRTGSGGHQQADANTFASWTVDYVKEDNCGAPNSPPWVYYGNMSTALNETGRPMWLATCNWGEVTAGTAAVARCGSSKKLVLTPLQQNPWLWAPSIAQSYRAGPDHLPLWDFPGSLNGQGVINIIEHFADINNYTEPYGWCVNVGWLT